MLKKLKQWREKWTVDHSVDVAVDLVLLLIDVIASPVLIIVRLIRYVIGDYVVNKIKECETSSQGGHQDVPVNEVVIESVEITEED